MRAFQNATDRLDWTSTRQDIKRYGSWSMVMHGASRSAICSMYICCSCLDLMAFWCDTAIQMPISLKNSANTKPKRLNVEYMNQHVDHDQNICRAARIDSYLLATYTKYINEAQSTADVCTIDNKIWCHPHPPLLLANGSAPICVYQPFKIIPMTQQLLPPLKNITCACRCICRQH